MTTQFLWLSFACLMPLFVTETTEADQGWLLMAGGLATIAIL